MSIIKASALSVALLGISSPAFAGEFFTGTRNQSSRFDNIRSATGHETLTSNRRFVNRMKGSSQKHFVNLSLSAENAQNGIRTYGFIERDAELNAEGTTNGGGIFGGGPGGFGGLGDLASASSIGSDINTQIGIGTERYLDGSLNASLEWGSANSRYNLRERGNTRFTSTSDFSEVITEDGHRTSGGSVFSFN